jgi:hypothetical protein
LPELVPAGFDFAKKDVARVLTELRAREIAAAESLQGAGANQEATNG